VPPPESDKAAAKATDQQCQKCGATFRWQPETEAPRAPLVLRLVTGSAKCDCGFGKMRRR
jgi:hypothetical protein